MTEAIGPSISDVARALMEARQSASRAGNAAAIQTAAGETGRTGHEGDTVTLSEAAHNAVRRPLLDDTESEAIPLSSLRKITPQGLRSDAEAGLQKIMDDLGVEGDFEFSIQLNDDGSFAVESDDPQAEALEAAINTDPALQRTFRELRMISGFAYHTPLLGDALESSGSARTEAFSAADAARERLNAASYTITMTAGKLTTAFVDPTGTRFGGVGLETEQRVAIWAPIQSEEGAPDTPDI
jgi:hypothetical protein